VVTNGAHRGRRSANPTGAPTATRIYYRDEFPERFHPLMDTRRWGPGERLVFEPYTKEAHAQTFEWIAHHGVFAKAAWATVATRFGNFAGSRLAALPLPGGTATELGTGHEAGAVDRRSARLQELFDGVVRRGRYQT
jgi:hypothetical protein